MHRRTVRTRKVLLSGFERGATRRRCQVGDGTEERVTLDSSMVELGGGIEWGEAGGDVVSRRVWMGEWKWSRRTSSCIGRNGSGFSRDRSRTRMLNSRGKRRNSCVISTDSERRIGWNVGGGHWRCVLDCTTEREERRIEVDVVRQARIGGIGEGRCRRRLLMLLMLLMIRLN